MGDGHIRQPSNGSGQFLGLLDRKKRPSGYGAIRLMPTNMEGALTRKQMMQRYADRAGIPISNFDFYYCFGLFRLAVIAQQIYFRYYHGQTSDDRFKMLILGVHVLENTARRVIEQSRL